MGAGQRRSRALSTNQENIEGPAERDVLGKVEWADYGAESCLRLRVARALQALWASCLIVP